MDYKSFKNNGLSESSKSLPKLNNGVNTVSCCNRWNPVELLAVFFYFSFVICNVVSKYYLYNYIGLQHGIKDYVKRDEKPCLHKPEETDNTTLQIQEETSRQFMHLNFASNIPALFATVFLGSVADKYGRKRTLLINISGLMTKTIIYVTVFQLELHYKYLFFGNIIEGFTGFYGTFNMATFGIIADVTVPTKWRTFRIALIEALSAITSTIIQHFTGYIIKDFGFVIPMVFASVVSVATVAFCVMFISETLRPQDHSKLNIFSLRYFFRCFQFYVKQTPGMRRKKLIALLVIFVLTFSAGNGKLSASTLFLTDRPLCWTDIHISSFNSIQTGITWIISVLVLLMAQNCCDLADINLVLFGSLSYSVYLVVFGCAQNDWMVYLSVTFGAMGVISIPVVRSMMSKICKSDEQGSLFAGICVMDVMFTMISSLIYDGVYRDTLGFFHGFIFVLMSTVFIVVFVIGIFLRKWLKEDGAWQKMEKIKS